MACPDLVIENEFIKVLHDTRTFAIKADTLILFNSDGIAFAKLVSVADFKGIK